jgi:hypothetical protein
VDTLDQGEWLDIILVIGAWTQEAMREKISNSTNTKYKYILKKRFLAYQVSTQGPQLQGLAQAV